MKKLSLVLLAALLCISLIACTAKEEDGNELDNYTPPSTTAKIDTGTLTFTDGPAESAVITQYSGKSEKHDVVIPGVINDREVSAIGDNAFRFQSLVTSIKLPDTIEYIGNQAFANCTSLTTIVIPASVKRIDAYAFARCTSLETVIFEGNSVEIIDDFAFFECKALKTIALPEGLKWIGEQSFALCTSLTSIKTPASLEHIGGLAFYGCTGLDHEGAIDLTASLNFKDTISDDQEILGIGHFAFTVERGTMKPTSIKTAPGSYAEEYVKNNLPAED